MKTFSTLVFALLFTVALSACTQTPDSEPENTNTMTEAEARAIAEDICISAGESLSDGQYNATTRTWWFDAQLSDKKEGCNPACVVFVDTGAAEINWRCTGLLMQEDSTPQVALELLFQEKYPEYADTLVVNINQATPDHVRGDIIFETGAPGGIFLATKSDGKWRIVFDGNGSIACDLAEYDFPKEMLSDCAE